MNIMQMDMFSDLCKPGSPVAAVFWVFSQSGAPVPIVAMTGAKAKGIARKKHAGNDGRFIDVLSEDELTMNEPMQALAKLLNMTPAGTDQQQATEVMAAAVKRIEVLKHSNWQVRQELEQARLDYLALNEKRVRELAGMLERANTITTEND